MRVLLLVLMIVGFLAACAVAKSPSDWEMISRFKTIAGQIVAAPDQPDELLPVQPLTINVIRAVRTRDDQPTYLWATHGARLEPVEVAAKASEGEFFVIIDAEIVNHGRSDVEFKGYALKAALVTGQELAIRLRDKNPLQGTKAGDTFRVTFSVAGEEINTWVPVQSLSRLIRRGQSKSFQLLAVIDSNVGESGAIVLQYGGEVQGSADWGAGVKLFEAVPAIASSSTGMGAPPSRWPVESAETNKAIVIPLESLIKTNRVLRGNSNGMTSLAISPDGKTLASGTHSRVMLWDLATAKHITTIEDLQFWVYALAFSPDGKILASGENSEINLWEVATWKKLKTLKDSREDLTDSAKSLAFSPDGKILVSAGWVDEAIIVWDVATGNKLGAHRGHKTGVLSVAFSPDGKTLASRGRDNNVILWDVATWSSVRTLEDIEDEEGERGIAFSPDGKILASGGKEVGDVFLWDVKTGQKIATLSEKDLRHVGSIAFSSDGRILAAANNDTVTLWDVAAGNKIKTLKYSRGTFHLIAFSPDGNILVSAVDKALILADLSAFRAFSGSEVEELTRTVQTEMEREIARLHAKSEFETTDEYKQRIRTAKAEEDRIRKRYGARIDAAREKARKELDERKTRLHPYTVDPTKVHLGRYDADRGAFQAEIEGNKVLINVPREKAREITERGDKFNIEGMLRYFDASKAELVNAFMVDSSRVAPGSAETKAVAANEYFDFSKYGYGKISKSSVSIGQLLLSSDGEFVPNDLIFKIDYEQLPVEDKIIVNDNNWYKEGGIFEIRLWPIGNVRPGSVISISIKTPSGDWYKLREYKMK